MRQVQLCPARIDERKGKINYETEKKFPDHASGGQLPPYDTLRLRAASPSPDSAQPPLETVTYSNLTDADSRKLLTEALADANVDETRTKLLLDRVDQFNASVKSEWLTGGFESAATTETRYDPYEMQDLWTEKNGSFPGYNCRITAFSLFGEFVTRPE